MKKAISVLMSMVFMLSVFTFASVGAGAAETAEKSSASNNPAKQAWTAAHDSFYSGFPEIKDMKISYPVGAEYRIRQELIYPINSVGVPTGDAKLLLATANNVKTPSQLEKLMVQKNEFGAVIEYSNTGKYYGEAFMFLDPEAKKALVQYAQQYEAGDFKDRESMTITEDLENQLLAKNFSPKTTTARALRLLRYANGVYFKDGENAAFYCSGAITLDGGGLKAGTLYTVAEISKDMENIANYQQPEPSAKADSPIGKPVI